eukprot:SAG31_NODE_8650_length_1413_cov_3.700152_2_plen_109_part_00
MPGEAIKESAIGHRTACDSISMLRTLLSSSWMVDVEASCGCVRCCCSALLAGEAHLRSEPLEGQYNNISYQYINISYQYINISYQYINISYQYIIYHINISYINISYL